MTVDPIGLVRTTYYPAHIRGTRIAPCLAFIVIHDEEASTDEAAGAWFQNSQSQGSANLGVDDDSTQLFLHDWEKPAGAPPLNNPGLHIEQAGFARFSRAQWMQHKETIARAAWQISRWCNRHGIPQRWLNAPDLRRIMPTPFSQYPARPQGITSHLQVTLAWPEYAQRFGSHTDPGNGYPVDILLALVKAFAPWHRTLRFGMVGTDVIRWKARLGELHLASFMPWPRYGHGVENATKQFQKAHGLPMTGWVDGETWTRAWR